MLTIVHFKVLFFFFFKLLINSINTVSWYLYKVFYAARPTSELITGDAHGDEEVEVEVTDGVGVGVGSS